MIVLAQEEARALRHNYIGTEHMLLGLLREEEGIGARVLRSLGVTVESARAGVVRMIGAGEQVPSGQIPFTPRAKKVLELALSEGLTLGHNYIGTEHILLGLARENEGVANRILLESGADSETITHEVIQVLSGAGKGGGSEGSAAPAAGTAGGPLRREGIPETALDGAAPLLQTLARELERELGRPADAGDMLVLLASIPGGLAARILAALGVHADELARAAEEARGGDARSALLPPADILADSHQVRIEKEAALEDRNFERAAELRDRERALLEQALEAVERRQHEVLGEVRARLGLSGP